MPQTSSRRGCPMMSPQRACTAACRKSTWSNMIATTWNIASWIETYKMLLLFFVPFDSLKWAYNFQGLLESYLNIIVRDFELLLWWQIPRLSKSSVLQHHENQVSPSCPGPWCRATKFSQGFHFLYRGPVHGGKLIALVGQSTERKEVVVAVKGTVVDSPSAGSCRPTK